MSRHVTAARLSSSSSLRGELDSANNMPLAEDVRIEFTPGSRRLSFKPNALRQFTTYLTHYTRLVPAAQASIGGASTQSGVTLLVGAQ
jgi:hypothetical protein